MSPSIFPGSSKGGSSPSFSDVCKTTLSTVPIPIPYLNERSPEEIDALWKDHATKVLKKDPNQDASTLMQDFYAATYEHINFNVQIKMENV